MTSTTKQALWSGAPGSRELDVVGLGQCSLDQVCEVDGIPRLGGKAAMLDFHQLPGGQVATALLGCARLGLKTGFLGAVGDDALADVVLAPLRAAGVDVAGVRRVTGAATQLAVILVDRRSGERTVLWHRDPALAPRSADLSRAAIVRARVLHLDGGDPEAGAWAAEAARKSGMAVVLDADASAPGMAELLAQVDFPIVSRSFAEGYFGTRSVREALRALAALGPRLAVITLGELGAIAQAGDQVYEAPGFAVTARDTTGAGDAFHAAFVWGLLQGLGPARILRVANAAAALNCRALGAQGGLPERKELEAFVESEEPRDWLEPDFGD